MHYFIRINGELFEVRCLTRPNNLNPTVKVTVLRTARIMRVDATEIIRDN